MKLSPMRSFGRFVAFGRLVEPVGLVGLVALVLQLALASAATADDGQRAYDKGNYAKAQKIWEAALEARDAPRKKNLGPYHNNLVAGRGRKVATVDKPAAMYGLAGLRRDGKGNSPVDVEGAVELYRRAADAGHPDAAYQIGRVYEMGMGSVASDLFAAIRAYEESAQLGNVPAMLALVAMFGDRSNVVYSQRQAANYLESAAKAGSQEVLIPLADRLRDGNGIDRNVVRAAELYRLALSAGQPEAEARLDGMLRGVTSDDGFRLSDGPVATASIDFGKFHALLIGNNDYQDLPRLGTAVSDVRAIAALLRSRYGFETTVIENASRGDILRGFAAQRKKLQPSDNLLIYYAGHGWLDEDAQQGYWLPVDSNSEDPTNWLSNDTITHAVRAMSAKHVMVVADSCYSGSLTRGIRMGVRESSYLGKLAAKRARTVITSGGLEPVADGGGGGHSVFARAMLSALEENRQVMEASVLFGEVRRPVMVNSDQTPMYGDIHRAGHDGGEFLFVPLNQQVLETAETR